MNQQMDKQLPEGWETTQLAEVADIILGQSPDGKTVNSEGKGIVFYQGKAEFGLLHPTPRNYCTNPKKIAKENDILLSVRAPVGPTNLANQETAIGRGLAAIRETQITNFKFILFYFRNIEQWLSQQGTGTTFQAISGQFIRDLPFPLPPLAEQHYLADKLDSLLARIQTLSEQLAAVPALLKQFRQSVLADAVSGKLINIKSLTYQNLNQCAKIHNGARKPISLKERNKIQGNIPYYGATGVVDYVNGYTHKGRFLLVGEDGANLLSKAKDLAYIVEGEIWVNNHAHVLKEYENYSLDFIKIVINSLNLSNWVTGTAQPKLTKKALESLPIPKFTFAEQTEIVRRVEALFALADQIEQQSRAAAKRVALLTQSVLAKAFRGELSAQWRCEHPDLISGDNSAAALLARIQAEREATGKKSRRA